MKKFTSNNKLLYIGGIVLFILFWQILSLLIGQTKMVLPGPFSTIAYSINLLKSSYTYKCIIQTLSRMLEGFVISFLIALIVGTVAGYYKSVNTLLKPTMVILKSVPTACLLYLFIVIAGIKNAPLYIVALVSFPILYDGFVAGVSNTPKELINASKLEGSSFFKECLYIRLPLAKNHIIQSVASSFSLSFKIEIMAEVITGGSNPGLGTIIQAVRAYNPTDLLPVFGYSLIAVMIMLLIDLIVTVTLKKTSL